MSQPTLFMLFGYPGAGKTTTAKLLAKLTGATHLSSDAIRLELFPNPTYAQDEHDTVYAELNRRTEALLSQGKDVIYDANLNRHQHRAEKYDMCERTGARPVLLWVQAPRNLARDRAVMRGHSHLVPKDETFESMFDRVSGAIEQPREGEPLVSLNGEHITKDTVADMLEAL